MIGPLLCCLIGTVGVSSIASMIVRSAAADLSDDERGRIARAEIRTAWIWQSVEWLGIALFLGGAFVPDAWLFGATRTHRILMIAGGLEVFCFSNATAAWSSRGIYNREAPKTKASRAATLAAWLVSTAELGLLAVVIWIVAARLDWFPAAKTNGQSAESASDDSSEKSVWMDEQTALKTLAHLDREYVQGLVESGSLRTKDVGGKKMYRQSDVEILKNRKKEIIP